MKACWLNKKNNKDLIVFFAGWSFDEKPFEFLRCEACDVLFVYDYTSIEKISEFSFDVYENKTLIAWSMGVYVAFVLREYFKDFTCKIAINGTVTPVDNKFGIPVKPFELTLKHAAVGLSGKFYKNVFNSEDQFKRYLQTPVTRTIEGRVCELESLYSNVKTSEFSEENFYDYAIISEFDKIIPPQNQKNSHTRTHVPIITLQDGHFPFYNFDSWKEIIELCR